MTLDELTALDDDEPLLRLDGEPGDALQQLFAARRRHGRPGPKSYQQLRYRRENLVREHRLQLPHDIDELRPPMLHPGAAAPPPIDRHDRILFYDFDGSPLPGGADHPYVPERDVMLRLSRGRFTYGLGRIGLSTLYHRGRALTVSTIFMGLDIGTGSLPFAVLWETMLFAGPQAGVGAYDWKWRYASRQAAYAGHRQVTGWLRRRLRERPYGWPAGRAW